MYFLLVENQGIELYLRFGDNGSLYDQDGWGINMDPQAGEMGYIDPYEGQQASQDFGVPEEYLFSNEMDSWMACPSGVDQFFLAMSEC